MPVIGLALHCSLSGILLAALWMQHDPVLVLLQQTRGPKLGSVSINMVTRQLAQLVFAKVDDIVRDWRPDTVGRRGGDVRWHKHQGIQELGSHYHKFANYLEGCPGDYDLPVHKPVFFDLLQLNPATGQPVRTQPLPALPAQRPPPAPAPPPPTLEIGAPPPLAETSIFASIPQPAPQPVNLLSSLPGAHIPPEVQALLPAEVQAQLAYAFQQAAQAKLQQAAPLPLQLQLQQLLQTQLLPASLQQAAQILQLQHSLPMQQEHHLQPQSRPFGQLTPATSSWAPSGGEQQPMRAAETWGEAGNERRRERSPALQKVPAWLIKLAK